MKILCSGLQVLGSGGEKGGWAGGVDVGFMKT